MRRGASVTAWSLGLSSSDTTLQMNGNKMRLPSPSARPGTAGARHTAMHASTWSSHGALQERSAALETILDQNLSDFRFAVYGRIMEQCRAKNGYQKLCSRMFQACCYRYLEN